MQATAIQNEDQSGQTIKRIAASSPSLDREGAAIAVSYAFSINIANSPFFIRYFLNLSSGGLPIRSAILFYVTIRISESDTNGCNNPIIIPVHGIDKKLVLGDNVVEFMLGENGVFGYSCWMGVIRSSITVKSTYALSDNDAAKTSTLDLPDATDFCIAPGDCCSPLAVEAVGSGGCCGSNTYNEPQPTPENDFSGGCCG